MSETAVAARPPAQRESVRVNLGERSYTIHIGRGLLAQSADLLAPLFRGRKLAIVADAAVAGLAEGLAETLTGAGMLLGAPVHVRSGEASKSFEGLERVCGALLGLGLERSHAVIAVGGGMTGDLAGFAAAIVKRGVALVQVPTTLLAQVDSSVGGKTGINTAHGKNLIGAFHQPAAVLADLDALQTLPAREFRSGYAEIVKYGLLGDAAFFAWLEQQHAALSRLDETALLHAIATSCRMKAAIVERDERESGERALLNLGHTFGHAVEAWAGYSGRVLHGEAVALGMSLAARFSERRGLCAEGTASCIAAHLSSAGLPDSFGALRALTGGELPSPGELLGFMVQDKKVTDGKLNLILLRRIGAAFVAQDVPSAEIEAFLADQLAQP
jgi:3-dehydroquinate synthase